MPRVGDIHEFHDGRAYYVRAYNELEHHVVVVQLRGARHATTPSQWIGREQVIRDTHSLFTFPIIQMCPARVRRALNSDE